MKEGPKFLSKEELKDKATHWRIAVSRQEQKKPLYRYDRIDTQEGGPMSVTDFHGVSFIKEVIPSLIVKKKNGEKVRILDVGAGAGFFADEIRQAFPDDVKVFSTGLSKKVARDFRKEKKPKDKQKIHQDDLKWRSVTELSDFEEFDLIIDTYGELQYTIQQEDNILNPKEAIINYLTILIKKLKPGGIASVAPFYSTVSLLRPYSEDILRALEIKYNVKISIPELGSQAIRIQKLN